MKSESPQSLFTAYDTEVRYVFTEAAYESTFTAGYAGSVRVKSAGKDRDRALIHYCWRADPDRLWLHHLHHRSADVAIHVDPDCHGGSPDHSDCRCRNAGCTSGGSQYQPWFIDAILKFFRY